MLSSCPPSMCCGGSAAGSAGKCPPSHTGKGRLLHQLPNGIVAARIIFPLLVAIGGCNEEGGRRNVCVCVCVCVCVREAAREYHPTPWLPHVSGRHCEFAALRHRPVAHTHGKRRTHMANAAHA
eukprot:354014-Chlamydomonas_euryale.AAC.2